MQQETSTALMFTNSANLNIDEHNLRFPLRKVFYQLTNSLKYISI